MDRKGKPVSKSSRRKSASRREAPPFDRWLERALKALNEAWGEAPQPGAAGVPDGHKKARD